jgi:hypothetical protein
MTLIRSSNALFIAIGILVLQAAVLFAFGQPPICTCGYVKLWEGAVRSSGNSQHLSDWYTFSHIIHGFVFYALLALLFPRVPRRLRFLMALGIEVGWEITENTPMVINHYRQQALAAGYVGDSIINSLSDSLSMSIGFLLASLAPWWATLGLALGLEIIVGCEIRDNLTLNVLNLIHQFPAIAAWQAGSVHP